MIFDAHAHVYPGSGGFWKTASTAEDLVAAMDRAGVGRAAVIAIAPHLPARAVCDAAAAYPGRLVPIGSVDPLADGALAAIEEQVRAGGVRGIKLHPRLQRVGIGDLPRLQPIAARCGELGVPLIVCTFLGGTDLFRGRSLELCHELACAAPATAIIMAHAGGHRPLDALMILKACPNISVDLSFSPLYFAGSSVTQDLEYLVKKADPRRVLFGSDFPEVSIEASVAWIQDVVSRLVLSASHREAILCGNALRLFHIE